MLSSYFMKTVYLGVPSLAGQARFLTTEHTESTEIYPWFFCSVNSVLFVVILLTHVFQHSPLFFATSRGLEAHLASGGPDWHPLRQARQAPSAWQIRRIPRPGQLAAPGHMRLRRSCRSAILIPSGALCLIKDTLVSLHLSLPALIRVLSRERASVFG